MPSVGTSFEVLLTGEKAPPGWNKVTRHLVFDVNMVFSRKERLVLDDHKTPYPISSTYARVVSRESVTIEFSYASLNGLNTFVADVRNAQLHAPASQK